MTFTRLPYYAPPAPDRSEDNILNVLNDDCLGEVFKRMGPLHRFEIEKVCKRFKRVAETASLYVYKTSRHVCFTSLNPDKNFKVTEIEKFLRRCGSSLVSVDLFERNCQHVTGQIELNFKINEPTLSKSKKIELGF